MAHLPFFLSFPPHIVILLLVFINSGLLLHVCLSKMSRGILCIVYLFNIGIWTEQYYSGYPSSFQLQLQCIVLAKQSNCAEHV